MELLEFLRELKRRKKILILIPALTLIAAFFIVRFVPDKYISHTRLATGIADKSQQLLDDNSYNQDSKVNQEFGNITQMLLLNKIVNQVSYRLILHDLQSSTPFNKLPGDVAKLSPDMRSRMEKDFSDKYAEGQELSLADKNDKQLYQLLKSEKYDNESIKKELKVVRVESSDFVDMNYSSNNPQLSAFVLNTLSDEFIKYYTNIVTENKRRSVSFLDSLMQQKKMALVSLMQQLKDYKIRNNILDMDEQARNIYGQLSDVAAKKGLAERDAQAYGAALNGINKHFDPKNRQYLESSVSGINQNIVNDKDELQRLNDVYAKSNYDAKYKPRIDSLKSKISAQIYNQADQYAYNPMTAKENLVTQRMNMEVSRDLAKNSVQSYTNELGSIQAGLTRMVPNVATTQAFTASIDIANKEYLDILQKYNQANMEASYILPIRQVEKAMPANAEPDKKMLLVILSGIVSLILCLAVLFVMFYFDHSIYTSAQLENLTKLPVLGALNFMGGSILNMQELWNQKNATMDQQVFKNLLRTIRYEVEKELHDGKVLAITSFKNNTGKTFVTTSLAYAFAKANKKVLIIDGNFMNPDITNSIKTQHYLESFLKNNDAHTTDSASINIIGNKGGDSSILELSSPQIIAEIFGQLKAAYDVILIETCTMENVNVSKAKEWIMFADKVITIFEAGHAIDGTADTEIKFLKQLGTKFSGFVLNKVPVMLADKIWEKEKRSKTLIDGISAHADNAQTAKTSTQQTATA